MRNIEIDSWGAENFSLFAEPMEIKVVNGRIVLVTGENGSGKTSLFDILAYALHGVTSKGLKGEDVVNDRTLCDCYAWVKFKVNEDEYKVDRYCKHKKNGSNVILYKNGMDKPIAVGTNEVREAIDKVFMSHKLLMNILFFSQKVKTFFTDLPDSDRKEIFRKILLLDDYVNYYKEVSKRLDKLDEDISKIKNNQIITTSLIKDCILEIKKGEEREKEFYAKKEKDISDIIGNIMLSQDKLIQLQRKLSDIEYEEVLQKKLEDVNQKISEVEMKSKLIDSEFQKKKDDIAIRKASKRSEVENAKHEREKEVLAGKSKTLADLQSIYSSLNIIYNNNISNLDQEISKRTSTISSNNSLVTLHSVARSEIFEKVFAKSISVCPVCDREITKDVVEKLRGKMTELDLEITRLEENTYYCNCETKDLKSKKATLKEEFDKETKIHERKVTEVEVANSRFIRELQDRAEETFKKLDKIEEIQVKELEEEKIKEKSNLPSLTSLFDEKRNVLLNIEDRKKIENEISSVRSKIESEDNLVKYKQTEVFDQTLVLIPKKKLEDLQSSLSKLSEEMIVVEKKYRVLSFLKKAFSPTGIPSMLIDDSIPFINETVSKYLDSISNGRYIVSFDTTKETKGGDIRDKISMNVLDTVTLANKREKLSGGQVRLIDIATILTLSRLQEVMQDVRINLLLFDEIFDSLDDSNISYVSRVLKEVSQDKAIFLISHRHIDLLEADEVLRLS